LNHTNDFEKALGRLLEYNKASHALVKWGNIEQMESLVIKKMCLAVLVLLAACSSQTTPAVTPLIAATQVVLQPTATLTVSALQPVIEPTQAPQAASVTDDNLPPVPSGCTVVIRQFSPEPTQQSLFPAVSDADWVIGSQAASLTLVEYADFQ
jgi:hypothetical protein